MRQKINGYISIFLALVALPVYSIAIVGTDLAKILALKNHLKLSGKIVADSGLSYYNKVLYDDFEVFALAKNQSMNEYIGGTLKDNLYYSEDSFYKADLADFDVEYKSSLINPEVLEKQILNYMSLEGPKKLSMGLINLISSIKDSQKYTPSLKSKMKYEKLYGKIEGNFDKLKTLFLDYEEVKDRLNKRFPIQESAYNSIQIELEKYKKNREILQEDKSPIIGGGKAYIKDVLDLKNYIEGEEPEEEAYLKRFSRLKDKYLNLKAEKNLDKEILETIKKIEKYNAFFIEKLDKDIEVTKQAYNLQYESTQKLIKECNDILSDLKKQVGYFKKDAESLTDSLQNWKNDLDKLEKSDYKTSMLNEYNISSLKLTEDNVNAVEKVLIKESDKLVSVKGKETHIKDVKMESLSRYKLYKYVTGISKGKIDNNKSKEAKATRKSIENFSKSQRPSISKTVYGQANSYIRRELFDKFGQYGSEYFDVNSDDMEANLKYYNMDGLNFYENLLIAQYIVDKFSSGISSDDFKGQAEYIIYGNNDLSKNIRQANNWIFAIRFGLNTIYAFTDAKLSGQANGLALAIAGWTGFAVPIVKSLILTSMSLGESFMDINDLGQQKKVAIFKNRSNWNMYLENLPMILAGTFISKAQNRLDSIYKRLESAVDKGVDSVDTQVEGFINETMKGFGDSISSSILAPLQSKLISVIDYPIDQIRNELSILFSSLKEGAGDDAFKISLISYVETSLFANLDKKIASFKDDYLNFEAYFTSITRDLEGKIYANYASYSSKFRNQMKTYIQDKKEMTKKYVEDRVNDYIGGLKGGNRVASKAGLSFSYKDYLIFLAALELSKADRDMIIGRIATVIDYRIRLKDSSFQFENMYTGLEIKLTAKLNLSKILAIFNKDTYDDTVEAYYD